MSRGSYALTAGLLGAAAIAFSAALYFHFPSDTTTVAIDDFGTVFAAMLAAAACGYAAKRRSAGAPRAWALLGLAALSWGLGGLYWAVVEVLQGVTLPFPSASDIGYLSAVPLAAAGILSFPSAPTTWINRLRLVLDGVIAGGALLFVAWGFGLRAIYASSHEGDLGQLIGLLYPITDVVLIVMLVYAVRRATGPLRWPTFILLHAYLFALVADAFFAYGTVGGTYGVLGSVTDSGWVIGFFGISLAALFPGQLIAAERVEAGPLQVWQLAIPWVAMLTVLATSISMGTTGGRSDLVLAIIGGTTGIMFLASQGIVLNDVLKLLDRSKRAEAALGERTTLLTEVVTHAPLGIARISPDLNFIDANPRCLQMFASPERQIVGESLTKLVPPQERPGIAERVAQLKSGSRNSVTVDGEMTRGDGTTIWVHRRVSAVRKPDGDVDYFVVLFEDTTAEHEAEQASLANLAALEKLSRLKSEFMSMVSHEFRTALTGIQGYSELMTVQDVTPDEVKEFAGDINSDALRLNRMITEMLDLDRIESGRISLHLATVDLNKILRAEAERAQMATTRHRVTTRLDARLPLIEADSDRLIEVVANLLSNAVKYSPNGGDIEVTSHCDAAFVEVSVKDHGQGIPPEFTSRIFGRYERYEAAGATKVVGTGLGLAIAQQIIQLHKGRIWVNSTVGTGSDFRFAIPLPASTAGSEPQVQPTPSHAA